jgi:Tol biopolymer transport system component
MPAPNLRTRLVFAGAGVVICVLLVGAGADAAFPGDNGSIFYGRKPLQKTQGIYSVEPKSGKSTLLTDGEGASRAPSASADGTEIVYIGSPSRGEQGLFTMTADGDRPMQVPTPGGLLFNSAAFSPDGEQIVFSAAPDDSTDEGDIWLMNRDGSDAEAIVTGKDAQTNPRFSPDGSRILFTNSTPRSNHSDVEEVKPDGSDVRDLTSQYPDQSDYSDADYSPDGRRIVLVTGKSKYQDGEFSETADLATMKADGKGLKLVRKTKQLETEPVFSPDGKSIAFVRYVSGTEMKVLTTKVSGRGLREVVSMENDISSGTPTWQPLP